MIAESGGLIGVPVTFVREAWAEWGTTLAYEDWLGARDSGYTYCGIIDNHVLASVPAV